MLIAIITALVAYNKAKANGRNGWLWAIVAAVVFIGTQFFTALVIGIGLGILVAIGQASDSIADDGELIINIIAIVASLVASWLLFKYLDRPRFITEDLGGPPPPPVFGDSSSIGMVEQHEATPQPKPAGTDLPPNRD